MVNKILKEVFTTLLKIVVIIFVFASIYKGATWAYASAYDVMAKSPNENKTIMNVDVSIPRGASTETIANILDDKGLISNALYFRIVSKFNGYDGQFQYGDYVFNTGMNEEDIMKILVTEGAKRETVKFTIPEGYTIVQIAKKLEDEGVCTSKDFMTAIADVDYGYKFISEIPERNLRLQGYLFPSTYEIYKDSTAQDVVSTMLKQFDYVFKDEYYTRAQELGYTVDQIISIASIIEKEVKVPEERAKVAGVIYNRLNINMNLQMCSTVMYVLDKPREKLFYKDLEIESPYNTYKYAGLPLGPIANPGEASIKAALYPEENDYLYFVLIDPIEGRHEFNTSLDAHNSAKSKYKQEF